MRPSPWLNGGKPLGPAVLGFLVSEAGAPSPGPAARLKMRVGVFSEPEVGTHDASGRPGSLQASSTYPACGTRGVVVCKGHADASSNVPPNELMPRHWASPALVTTWEDRWLFWPFAGDTQAPAGHWRVWSMEGLQVRGSLRYTASPASPRPGLCTSWAHSEVVPSCASAPRIPTQVCPVLLGKNLTQDSGSPRPLGDAPILLMPVWPCSKGLRYPWAPH